MKAMKDPTGMKSVFMFLFGAVAFPIVILVYSPNNLGIIAATLIFVGLLLKAALRYREAKAYNEFLADKYNEHVAEVVDDESIRQSVRHEGSTQGKENS